MSTYLCMEEEDPWSLVELDLLLSLVHCSLPLGRNQEKPKLSWKEIASRMNQFANDDFRRYTGDAVHQIYHLHLKRQVRDDTPWTSRERELLLSLIGNSLPFDSDREIPRLTWREVAAKMNESMELTPPVLRLYTAESMQEHYHTIMGEIELLDGTAWTEEENNLMLSLVHHSLPGGGNRNDPRLSWREIASIMNYSSNGTESPRRVYTAIGLAIHYDNNVTLKVISREDAFYTNSPHVSLDISQPETDSADDTGSEYRFELSSPYEIDDYGARSESQTDCNADSNSESDEGSATKYDSESSGSNRTLRGSQTEGDDHLRPGQ